MSIENKKKPEKESKFEKLSILIGTMSLLASIFQLLPFFDSLKTGDLTKQLYFVSEVIAVVILSIIIVSFLKKKGGKE